jgi:hypothetical protein
VDADLQEEISRREAERLAEYQAECAAEVARKGLDAESIETKAAAEHLVRLREEAKRADVWKVLATLTGRGTRLSSFGDGHRIRVRGQLDQFEKMVLEEHRDQVLLLLKSREREEIV